jgi:hypothetical protein
MAQRDGSLEVESIGGAHLADRLLESCSNLRGQRVYKDRPETGHLPALPGIGCRLPPDPIVGDFEYRGGWRRLTERDRYRPVGASNKRML